MFWLTHEYPLEVAYSSGEYQALQEVDVLEDCGPVCTRHKSQGYQVWAPVQHVLFSEICPTFGRAIDNRGC